MIGFISPAITSEITLRILSDGLASLPSAKASLTNTLSLLSPNLLRSNTQEAELPGVISVGLQSSTVSMFSLKSITVNRTNGSTTV